MEKELKYGKMVLDMKENILMVENMEKVFWNLPMVQYMKEIFFKMTFTIMVLILGQIKDNI